MTVTNAAYNGALAPGAAATFGLLASVTGANDPPTALTVTTR